MKIEFNVEEDAETTNHYTAEIKCYNDEDEDRTIDYIGLEVEGNLSAINVAESQGCIDASIRKELSSIVIIPTRGHVRKDEDSYVRLTLEFNNAGKYRLIPRLNLVGSHMQTRAGERMVEVKPEHLQPSHIYKLIVGGDGGVGKTALVIRACEGVFKEDTVMTLGTSLTVKEIAVHGNKVKLQIWDFGGQERFSGFVLPIYCKGASAAILAFDTTQPTSFKNLPGWLEMFRKSAGNIPIVLVGTKVDLEHQRSVKAGEAETFSKKNNLESYLDTSSRTGLNIDNVFSMIAELASTYKRESRR